MNSKYYNVKTRSADGTVHDSGKEAHRWDQLCILQRAGKIEDLKRQVKFELIPAQYETYERFGKLGQRLSDGKRLVERPCVYLADFVYKDVDTGQIVVEDTKSSATVTKDYVIKRKLMLFVHHIRIKQV